MNGRSTTFEFRPSFALLLWLVVFVSIVAGCRSHTTEPPPPRIDTTSHAIQWRTDTLGYGNSVVRGIDIVDDNNIWAVGSFYLMDSTGKPDSTMYNVLRWDGMRWNPMRLTYYYQGYEFLIDAYAVFAFSADDIWISLRAPLHFDGRGVTLLDSSGIDFGGTLGFWGTSSSDLYIVGRTGKLTHFNGSTFTSIPTGVQSRFCDIYGSGDKVYIGSYYYDNQIRPSGVFVYDKAGFRFLFPDSSNTPFESLRDAMGVWVSPKGNIWAVGESDVFKPQNTHVPLYQNPFGWLLSIRGLSDSDVWTAGVGSSVLHFNGITWKDYPELRTTYAVEYHHIAVKGSTVAVGGISYNPIHVVLTVGHRPK